MAFRYSQTLPSWAGTMGTPESLGLRQCTLIIQESQAGGWGGVGWGAFGSPALNSSLSSLATCGQCLSVTANRMWQQLEPRCLPEPLLPQRSPAGNLALGPAAHTAPCRKPSTWLRGLRTEPGRARSKALTEAVAPKLYPRDSRKAPKGVRGTLAE